MDKSELLLDKFEWNIKRLLSLYSFVFQSSEAVHKIVLK